MIAWLLAPLILLAAPFDRDLYPHWIDADGDCMNSRHEVLERDSLTPVVRDSRGCQVREGLWLGPYSGEVYTAAAELDVDHVIPLAWAHAHGADAWEAETRRRFANDPRNLLAAGARWNRQKGAKGPADWRPPASWAWCAYASRFEALARTYGLELPEADQVAITLMRETCQ